MFLARSQQVPNYQKMMNLDSVNLHDMMVLTEAGKL